nr:type II toxin-antitoxin system HigB family toxin [Paraburkholderia fynbosensis]
MCRRNTSFFDAGDNWFRIVVAIHYNRLSSFVRHV